jgi:hypothetical protein
LNVAVLHADLLYATYRGVVCSNRLFVLHGYVCNLTLRLHFP